ncbi:hypothetical protein [Dehalogenimonas formicexedens]|uniref:hypothetical protein n=1 Tax=Dehalogenimonas formicexedens TaxID=1839801 RepID=UPI001314A955|nr:hypothetical protein [Dehalogenimonas formicexedens]
MQMVEVAITGVAKVIPPIKCLIEESTACSSQEQAWSKLWRLLLQKQLAKEPFELTNPNDGMEENKDDHGGAP